MVIQRCLGRAAALAVMALALTVPARGDGFRGGVREALGPRFEAARDGEIPRIHARRGGAGALARLRDWNAVAIDASGLDHTPVAAGENRVFGEQLGPGPFRAARWRSSTSRCSTRSTRIAGGYRELHRAPGRRDQLVDATRRSRRRRTTRSSRCSRRSGAASTRCWPRTCGRHPGRTAKTDGIALGRARRGRDPGAARRRRLRSIPSRGSASTSSRATTRASGARTRSACFPLALGAHWGEVRPFVLASAGQFRVPPPPPWTAPRTPPPSTR